MEREYRIENCANSAESAVRAELGGAYRVELCAGMPEGGTTPSYGEIRSAREAIGIKLNVIIRPRGGDFCYTSRELQTMLYDIEMARSLGVDGLVLGCLTPSGEVDIEAMTRLMAAAGDTPVTFHRAIDVCRDMQQALEDIIELGCKRILTSGGAATALEGIERIGLLTHQAAERIIIMPGSGVNASNIVRLARETGVREFHFSARTDEPSSMTYRHEGVSMGGTVTIDEYMRPLTSPDKIREAIEALRQI